VVRSGEHSRDQRALTDGAPPVVQIMARVICDLFSRSWSARSRAGTWRGAGLPTCREFLRFHAAVRFGYRIPDCLNRGVRPPAGVLSTGRPVVLRQRTCFRPAQIWSAAVTGADCNYLLLCVTEYLRFQCAAPCPRCIYASLYSRLYRRLLRGVRAAPLTPLPGGCRLSMAKAKSKAISSLASLAPSRRR